PLHSIGINYTMLNGIHFIQSRYIAPLCIQSTAFNHAAWDHAISYLTDPFFWITFYQVEKAIASVEGRG
ncbi:hypothetical protein PSZ55_23750, partial [Shigella sonnei]|nr:hypothetical protein [Shigella sonnei]